MKIKVAEYVRKAVDDSKLSNIQIAELVGWKQAQVVSMIANGKCLFPINKVGSFAKAISFNKEHCVKVEKELSMLLLMEYHPELAASLLKNFPAKNSTEGRITKAVMEGLEDAKTFKLDKKVLENISQSIRSAIVN